MALFYISKISSLNHTYLHILRKKILKIYIQYTALIYQINLEKYQPQKVILYFMLNSTEDIPAPSGGGNEGTFFYIVVVSNRTLL